jgi:hypothetical protein
MAQKELSDKPSSLCLSKERALKRTGGVANLAAKAAISAMAKVGFVARSAKG